MNGYADKKIAVFGSTGSIGRQTLDVMKHLSMRPFALVAGGNDRLMEEQIRAFHPRFASLSDTAAAARLRTAVQDTDTVILSGPDAPTEIAGMDGYDTALCAMSGIAGLKPTLAAIHARHNLALANKETLVCGGELVRNAIRKNGVTMLPVDSEHSAIFQSLRAGRRDEVSRLILTCSGGPFFGRSFEELEKVTPAEALRHPSWRMGPKITVDCATLMNKGLELIEAMCLFDVGPEDIEIVIHRESVFHSFAAFRDGAVIGQAASPDMRLAIQYALTYPARIESDVKPLSFTDYGRLTFYAPDEKAFPCLALAKEAARRGGGAPVILNGANEAAVALYLAEKIGFNDIPRAVEAALLHVRADTPVSFEDIQALDREARVKVYEFTRQPSSLYERTSS